MTSLGWIDRILLRLAMKLEFDGVDFSAACAVLTKISEAHWDMFPNECLARLTQHAWSQVAWIEVMFVAAGAAMFLTGTSCCLSTCCARRFLLPSPPSSPPLRATRRMIREEVRKHINISAAGKMLPSSDSDA